MSAMDARGIRHVVANLKKASGEFRRLHDAATSTMHVDDVRHSNVARANVEGVVEELDDIERIPGIEVKLLASVQDNVAAARRLLQSRRVFVGTVSPSSVAAPSQGGAAGVDDQTPLVASLPHRGMDPHFRAPLRVPSVASVASDIRPGSLRSPSGSRSPSIASTTASVRRERAQILVEARRRRTENLVRIAEEERDAEEQARVAMAAAEKVRRMAKNKAMLERQQAEDEYEFSEIDADEVLEEAGVDPHTLRDRLSVQSNILPPPPPPSSRDNLPLQSSLSLPSPLSRRVVASTAVTTATSTDAAVTSCIQEKEDAKLARRLQEEEKKAEMDRRDVLRREKASRQLAQAAASAPVPEIHSAPSSASQLPSSAMDQLYLLEVLKNRRPAVKFTGGSFDAFEAHHQSFLSAMDIDGISSSTKMRELSSWYSGAAGKVVSRFVRRKDVDQAYLEVIGELKSLWGMRLTTAPEMLSSILQGKPISSNNVSAVRMFFIELGNVYQLAVETGRAIDFDRRSVHDDVLKKLPQWKSKWVEKRAKLEVGEVDKLTFPKLLGFLRQRLRVLEESTPLSAVFSSEEDEEEMPVASSGNSMMSSRRGRGRNWSPRRTSSPSLGVTSGFQPEAESCVCCSAPHFVENCRIFKGFSAAEKADVARRSGLCYSCLDQGHTSRTCTRKKSCATCKRDHHDLMHEWLTSNPISARIQSGAAAAAI